MRAALGGLAAALALSGCVTVVRVCPQDATVVGNTTLGLTVAPRTVGVGLTRSRVVAIPVEGCGVAIVENPSPQSRALLSAISARTVAHCLKGSQ